jgi:hypothetical protein
MRALSVLILLLAGCTASANLSSAGSQVREIQRDWATSCTFLEVIEVQGGLTYTSLAAAKRDMLNKLRNKTAELKGNSIVITSIVVDRGFSLPFAQADAYKCQ